MRKLLPTGTKISGYGEKAEVIRDYGGKMLRVRVTREENWHYTWRGNDIQVIEEPEMKEEFYMSQEYLNGFYYGHEWLQTGVK